MSREIKFRMWTGSKMLYDVSNVYECLKQQKAFDEGYKIGQQIGVIPYDHVGDGSVFLQSTGLKDKNGVEIFEGDVVQGWVSRYPNDKTTGSIEYNVHAQAFQVRYENCFNGHANEFMHQYHFFEVIGNIYSNPELLKP